jgi:hypothetical protein
LRFFWSSTDSAFTAQCSAELMTTNPKPPSLTPEDQQRRRKRSLAIALALAAIVVLFYAVTIAKLGPQVLNRPL